MDKRALLAAIRYAGMTVESAARVAQVSKPTFYRKLDGKSDFTCAEVVRLSNLLGLSVGQRDAIFLGDAECPP